MPSSQRKKRCICGRSSTPPLCDGSHRDEGWVCGTPTDEWSEVGFVASHSLTNLAERLAHRTSGLAVHRLQGSLHCDRLFILTDGQDVAALHRQLERVESPHHVVIAVGCDPEVIRWAFERALCVGVSGADTAQLWAEVERIVGSPTGDNQPGEDLPRPRIFLSHAVADEDRLLPLIEGLRRNYRLDIFLCADSIRYGDAWKETIKTQVIRSDVFLFINSAAARKSTFCAFEAGMALALGKPVSLLNLDGAELPLFLQDIQASDVLRLRNSRPWLSPSDAILEAILGLLGESHPG
jgi:hypothetical protein